MSTIHLNPMSEPKHISRVEINLRRGFKRILIALISTIAFTSFAAANEITFNEGYWAGQPIPNDPEFGCHMAMQLDDDTMMLIYSNAAGRFDLGFSSKKWNILQEQDAETYLDIDDQPITFNRHKPQ